jgi:hypothetical protein
MAPSRPGPQTDRAELPTKWGAQAKTDVAVNPWTLRRGRTAELRERHAFARELLDFYGALIGVQEHAFEQARSARPPAQDLVAYTAEMVMPSVGDVTISAGPKKLRDEVARRLAATRRRDRASECTTSGIAQLAEDLRSSATLRLRAKTSPRAVAFSCVRAARAAGVMRV